MSNLSLKRDAAITRRPYHHVESTEMRSLIIAVALLITACGTAPAKLGEHTLAIAQVCFVVRPSTDPAVSFVGKGTARQGTEPLDLMTSAGQAVFMAYGDSLSEGRALLVSVDAKVTYFVFSVPRRRDGYENWSPWQLPDFETQEKMAAVHMAQGRTLDAHIPLGNSAPYVRYKIMRFNDYLNYMKLAPAETIPPCGAQQSVPADRSRPADSSGR